MKCNFAGRVEGGAEQPSALTKPDTGLASSKAGVRWLFICYYGSSQRVVLFSIHLHEAYILLLYFPTTCHTLSLAVPFSHFSYKCPHSFLSDRTR